jgi:hypothetical protein
MSRSGPAVPSFDMTNLIVWVLQVLVAAVFLFSAVTKGSWSKERLVAAGQTGVAPVPLPLLRFVATMELAGVLGLLLPWSTGVARVLTPLAAVGLGMIMIGAASVHLRLGEPRTALGNLAILAACTIIAVTRLTALT